MNSDHTLPDSTSVMPCVVYREELQIELGQGQSVVTCPDQEVLAAHLCKDAGLSSVLLGQDLDPKSGPPSGTKASSSRHLASQMIPHHGDSKLCQLSMCYCNCAAASPDVPIG